MKFDDIVMVNDEVIIVLYSIMLYYNIYFKIYILFFKEIYLYGCL